ncbi:MAG: cupin domain-containing protein [Actinomycetota bacterium]|nr:cupin domain-containing protein [Actinomycetota bacterium]
MEPYALPPGDGRTYNDGIDFTVKAGELRSTNGAAVIEYVTRQGEEPPDHTHPTEDEMFYVLTGELTFRCGDRSFDVGAGGFVFLPHGVEHGYTMRSTGPIRLLVVTAPPREPSESWGGFVAGFEENGQPVGEGSDPG